MTNQNYAALITQLTTLMPGVSRKTIEQQLSDPSSLLCKALACGSVKDASMQPTVLAKDANLADYFDPTITPAPTADLHTQRAAQVEISRLVDGAIRYGLEPIAAQAVSDKLQSLISNGESVETVKQVAASLLNDAALQQHARENDLL